MPTTRRPAPSSNGASHDADARQIAPSVADYSVLSVALARAAGIIVAADCLHGFVRERPDFGEGAATSRTGGHRCIISSLKHILVHDLCRPQIEDIGPDASLDQDLKIDSVALVADRRHRSASTFRFRTRTW
jgi:hypothetical protein